MMKNALVLSLTCLMALSVLAFPGPVGAFDMDIEIRAGPMLYAVDVFAEISQQFVVTDDLRESFAITIDDYIYVITSSDGSFVLMDSKNVLDAILTSTANRLVGAKNSFVDSEENLKQLRSFEIILTYSADQVEMFSANVVTAHMFCTWLLPIITPSFANAIPVDQATGKLFVTEFKSSAMFANTPNDIHWVFVDVAKGPIFEMINSLALRGGVVLKTISSKQIFDQQSAASSAQQRLNPLICH